MVGYTENVGISAWASACLLLKNPFLGSFCSFGTQTSPAFALLTDFNAVFPLWDCSVPPSASPRDGKPWKQPVLKEGLVFGFTAQ